MQQLHADYILPLFILIYRTSLGNPTDQDVVVVGGGGGGGFHGHNMSGGGRGSITSPVRSAGGGGGSSVPGAGFCLSNISGSVRPQVTSAKVPISKLTWRWAKR